MPVLERPTAFAPVWAKALPTSFKTKTPIFFCLQETKLQAGRLELELPGYHQYWNYADKKGYSGVAVFCRQPPVDVRWARRGRDDHEGRAITLEFPAFYLINVCTPTRRTVWRASPTVCSGGGFRAYLTALDQKKPVVVCGDLNVAHREST